MKAGLIFANASWISDFKRCAGTLASRGLGMLMVAGLGLELISMEARANPQGGVVQQGTASFSSQGPQMTVRTSDRAYINWQSFNINPGETTGFVQPSASSVVWNRINDPNPSQILGNLNANGLVVLQNTAGFYVGGQAAITAQGLVMTTSPSYPTDFMGGGAWQFNGPPPTASIINYGQINAGAGGAAFLIGRNIDNHGSITAPGGRIGLYAGGRVLLSERPDGLGLSAQVKLPQGFVDNEGRIIADAGTIALHAQVVNQGGLIQADSVREHNGVIELVASESVSLGATSVIEAKGGSQGVSPGGRVLVKSDGQFTDTATSTITVAGGAEGGQGGQVEVSAAKMGSIQSRIDGSAAPGALHGKLFIDPYNISLAPGGLSAGSGDVNEKDPPTQKNSVLKLDPSSFSSFSEITLQAINNITFGSFAQMTLPDSSTPATLTLQAGNNITFNSYSGIFGGKNWSVSMVAGADFKTPTSVHSGTGGIYLTQYAAVQTQDGSISAYAGKEVQVRGGAIRTMGGGSVSVRAESGDVNAGTNPNGYIFDDTTATGYHVDPQSDLGGISTGAGGDVTIFAGHNVVSFFPTSQDAVQQDGGSGAFGPEPGVVSVTAAGSVYGHFVAANSERNGQNVASTITALTGDAGGNPQATTGSSGNPLALSLVKGGWEVDVPNGSIYMQEVRNPNGVFDNFKASSATWHNFDYDPEAFVHLNAANEVYLQGGSLPRPNDSVPIIYPPTLTIEAGAGGVLLGASTILFPSAYGELNITTHDKGSLTTDTAGTVYDLTMSDSGRTQWTGQDDFSKTDHASTPVQLNNPNPVVFDIAGNIQDLKISTPKQTQFIVGGEMDNTSFLGQNLHPGDVTSIDVAGRLWNRNDYTFEVLSQGLTPVVAYPGAAPDYLEVLRDAVLSGGTPAFPNFSFVYNPTTQRLGFKGRMSFETEQLLLGSLQIKTYGPDGKPILDADGNYITKAANFGADPAIIADLYTQSQNVPTDRADGYQIGGPGTFNIRAASLDLGVTYGVISAGPSLNPALARLPYGTSSADISIKLQGDLDMYSSTIASFGSGSINIYAGGAINIGSQELLSEANYARGIYSSGQGDVTVIARGSIDLEGSRIAAYNGGDVLVESLEGNVSAGSGASSQVLVPDVAVNPETQEVTVKYQPIVGSGILATTLPDAPASEAVGDLTVLTPRGDIVASRGGIVQDPLNDNRSLEPTLTLRAGTRDANGKVVYAGNIDASDSGVIGVNASLDAAGNITGLVVARGNSDISAAANVSGTFFSAGTANLNAGGTVSGTVIGVGGISASAGKMDASMLSQNVSVNGAKADSGLGTAATATTTSQSAVQNAEEETSKQVASAQTDGPAEDQKKRRGKGPVLKKSVGRVTVILPGS